MKAGLIDILLTSQCGASVRDIPHSVDVGIDKHPLRCGTSIGGAADVDVILQVPIGVRQRPVFVTFFASSQLDQRYPDTGMK